MQLIIDDILLSFQEIASLVSQQSKALSEMKKEYKNEIQVHIFFCNPKVLLRSKPRTNIMLHTDYVALPIAHVAMGAGMHP